MKVVCDNCGAVYKIPQHKLVKEVNKATCRKCGHRIMIRREAQASPAEPENNEEATVIAEASKVSDKPLAPKMDPHPPFGTAPEEPTPLPTSPMEGGPAPAPHVPTPMPMPTPGGSYGHQPTPAPAPSPAATGVPMTERAHDPTGDLTVILLGAAGAGVGGIVLALASAHFAAHFAGLFLSLWGSFLIVLVILTGMFGRRRAWIFASMFLSLILAGTLAAAFNPLTIRLISGDLDFGDVGVLAQRISTAPEPAQPAGLDAVADAGEEPDAALEPDKELEDRAALEAEAEDGADDGTPHDLLDVLATEEPEPEAAPEPEPEPEPAPAPVATSSSRSGSSSTGSSSTGSSSRSGGSSTGSSSTGSSSRSGSSSSGSSTSSSSSRQPSSSSSSSSSSSQPSSSSSSSSSSGQKTIPTTVIDIQIRNNKNIKACFLAHKKSTGELPSVTMRFTLEPEGSVSSASLREPAYQGTALESCLSGSVKMIAFPSFDGPAYTLNYPFRF
jgi:predicted Zn finger-like uncharacterized protein